MCIVEMSILYVQPGVNRDPHNCARVLNSYCSETEVYTKVIVVQINGPLLSTGSCRGMTCQAKPNNAVTIQYSRPGHGPQMGHKYFLCRASKIPSPFQLLVMCTLWLLYTSWMEWQELMCEKPGSVFTPSRVSSVCGCYAHHGRRGKSRCVRSQDQSLGHREACILHIMGVYRN